MIRIIPEWLQEAIDFINQEFPEDKDVTVTVLYGYDCIGVSNGDELGFAVYHTDTHCIYLADPSEIRNTYDLNLQEAIEATFINLFHEYRHHQQNIYNLDMSEEDADNFAEQMKFKFMYERR